MMVGRVQDHVNRTGVDGTQKEGKMMRQQQPIHDSRRLGEDGAGKGGVSLMRLEGLMEDPVPLLYFR